MLKQFDENKDGKISKEEATDGLDKVFAAIDSNNDGSLTPGEIRQYRQAEHAKRKTRMPEQALRTTPHQPHPRRQTTTIRAARSTATAIAGCAMAAISCGPR